MDATTTALGGVPVRTHGNEHTTALELDLGATPDPTAWAVEHAGELRAALAEHGLLMLRALPVELGAFHAVVETVGGKMLEYTERSTPRTAVSGTIYTSTDYPADQAIPMHNENSYSDRWPAALFFFCEQAATVGGATPVADSRAVLRLLPARLRENFRQGVLYTRTFRDGLGLSWQEAFQTQDRRAVEDYCVGHRMQFEWIEDGLRTRQRRPATLVDPGSGEEVWFNQANLFHISSLDPEIRETLLEAYDERDLPRNAYLGDGGALSEEQVQTVNAAYAQAAVALPWEPGSVLMVNNTLMAHGRQPYSGARRILVAMT
jgi:alpha-ketoglutarate-dependent taurine dioxygenase